MKWTKSGLDVWKGEEGMSITRVEGGFIACLDDGRETTFGNLAAAKAHCSCRARKLVEAGMSKTKHKCSWYDNVYIDMSYYASDTYWDCDHQTTTALSEIYDGLSERVKKRY